MAVCFWSRPPASGGNSRQPLPRKLIATMYGFGEMRVATLTLLTSPRSRNDVYCGFAVNSFADLEPPREPPFLAARGRKPAQTCCCERDSVLDHRIYICVVAATNR
jgi:hypothetical protein